ncbi:hypothetical protein SteCoe_31706 [Stentor coeruleus]|uniref:Uncharacterized protein n=1 Tax=Stentor coeruleus TaxID=5963 RepID=A0A1R2B0L0_9CILI|nr:hypothetical protein SteCoe_31706 [Stentor coeruleus]
MKSIILMSTHKSFKLDKELISIRTLSPILSSKSQSGLPPLSHCQKSSPNFSNKTQSIAIQTECTDTCENEVLLIHSPGSCFSSSSYGEMVKLIPCQGDLHELIDLFNDTSLSSIQESNSNEELSILKSFVEEYPEEEETPKRKISKYISGNDGKTRHIRKPRSPDLFFAGIFGGLSKTPNFHRYHTSKCSTETNLSESYEEMIGNLGGGELLGSKESLLQLIQIEKISLQKQLHKKRYPSGNFLRPL